MGLVIQELDYCLRLDLEHMVRMKSYAGIELEKANQNVCYVVVSESVVHVLWEFSL